MSLPAARERTSLREIALLFLRLGTTAFGGPAAHVAMMHVEVVQRRKWLSEQRFLDLVSAAQLIPGPNSTELAIHIGWERRGWPGLIVAGLAFIVPAMLITIAFGAAYVRFGSVPSVSWLLYGVKPVILAVVLQAIWNLAPIAARTSTLRVLGVVVMALAGIGVGIGELGLLLAAGVAASVIARVRDPQRTQPPMPALLPMIPLSASVAGTQAITLSGLFWVFLKIGSVLFGSGYVLLAFLRAELVLKLGWLSEAQLIDAIAVGQITPGPVFTTATFIGYVLSGPSGAWIATAGIFLPAFVFVALSAPWIPKLRASATASAFLDGVNVASLALMIVVTFQLGRAALIDLPAVVLAILSALLLVRFKLNATWLVIGGASAGWLLHFTNVISSA